MVLNSQNLSQELLNDPYYATVETRLTRIGALLGEDWSSVERVLGLQMALQLLPLVSDNPSDVS